MPRRLSFVGLSFSIAVVGFFLGRVTSGSTDLLSDSSRPSTRITSIKNRSLALSQAGKASESATGREKLIAEVRRIGAAPPSGQAYDELRRMLTAWVKLDPKAALEYVGSTFPKDRQEQLVPEMLGVWAAKDPRAAWDWASHPADENLTQLTLFDAVLSETGKTDGNLAWSLAAEAAEERPFDAQSLYVSALRGILYKGDYAIAAQLVTQAKLPKMVEGRYDLTSLIASDWGRYEPEKAATWVLGLPAGFDQRQALITLGQSWATIDAQAAADFAVNLPPSPERQAMLTTAVDRWATDHPGQVGEWLLRYEQSPDFDQVIAAVASSDKIVRSNVQTSIEWASSITDYDVRLQTLAKIMDQWISSDAESAKKYLRTSVDLPIETRNDLRKRLRLD